MSKHRSPLIQLFLRNPVFANILMLTLLIGGMIGWNLMVRESFPDIDVDVLNVTVAYPGADPDEVEEGICQPLEDALEGIADVKRVYTIAAENAGSAYIEVTENGDMERVKDDVKTQVDAIDVFPEDAEKPIIREISFEKDVLNLILWGNLPERQLKELSREIKEDLEAVDGVSRVVVFGTRDYEVSIEVAEERLRQYGLTFDEIAGAIRMGSLNIPGGSVDTVAEELKIRIVGRRYYAQQFLDIVVATQPNGAVVRLGDVAQCLETFDQDAKFYARFNGQSCVRIQVKKTKNEDSIRISEGVNEYLQRKREKLPDNVKLSVFFDVSRMVEDRLNLLKWNGLIGLSLVFICLWLFLDLRLSTWVTLGIPISIAGALLIMYMSGQTLNMLSMFGLILVLGIIVDDAIVVGEAIYVHRSRGEGPYESAVAGMQEVFWPVVTAVLTTVLAFIPLFFVAGVTGKFIGVLPGPVVAALLISLLEALLILPVHLRHLPRMNENKVSRLPMILQLPGRVRQAAGNGLIWVSEKIYAPVVQKLLQWRYATIATSFALIMATIGVFMADLVKYRFFPKVDGDLIMADIRLQKGIPVTETAKISQRLLEAWQETEKEFLPQLKPYSPRPMMRLRNWLLNTRNHRDRGDELRLAQGVFALIGGNQGQFGTASGEHLTNMWIELMPAERRNIHYMEILESWRSKVEPIPGAAKVTFQGMAGGPPGGNLQFDLSGLHEEALMAAQHDFMNHLKSFGGVYEINTTHEAGKRELRVRLKDEAHSLGLTLMDVGVQLRQGFYGEETMRIQRDGNEVKVMLRYPKSERQNEAALDQLMIRTPDGREVPFTLIASIERAAGYASIRRENGLRTIGITAEVDKTVDVDHVIDDIMANYVPTLKRNYGVKCALGAEVRDKRKSTSSMQTGALFALLMIFLLMATIFKSYLQPMIIMFTIPFGLMGAIAGHVVYQFVTGREMPLTFMSLLGMVALTGIVVNDSIVLIVAANERVRKGMPFLQALQEAGKRRFRAIVLTTMTTFIGLFPMILERSFQAQVLIPMALSVAFGVMFGTVATLILIPCLLAILNDLRRVFHLTWKLQWPTREQVELTEEMRRNKSM